MRVIKNLSGQKLEIPFEFKTYIFEKGETVLAENELADFLMERLPMSFQFREKHDSEKVAKVKSFKTKSFFPSQDDEAELGTGFMKIKSVKQKSTFDTPDGLPVSGQKDKDGIEFYGGGIEPDTI